MNDKELQDKQLKEQSEKVASKDDFPIFWIDRISLFLSHTIKYLIPVIVLVMMYEIFMRYVLFKPTLWANELCLWLAGVCYLVGGIYATRLRSHIRIVLLYDYVNRPTQRIFDLISTVVIVLFAGAGIYGGMEDAYRSFVNWERFATDWDPPIPATMKPLTLICVFLIALQSINNLIIDWRNPKERQYDPAKDLE
jgi:TRAP-type C4-dicarboxylate transport system permease small subunit